MGVDHMVCLPGNGRADHIDDAQSVGTLLLGEAQGSQGISGFARLGNDDHQVAGAYDGVIVAIFRCHIHAHRNPCKPFDEVFAHGAGVHGCTTGNNLDMAAVLKEVLRDFVPLEVGQTVLYMGNNGFAEGLGLFIDLLEHEVVKAALLCLFHIPVGMAQLPGNRGEAVVIDMDRLRGDLHNVAVLQDIVVLGVLEGGRNIRENEVLTLAHSGNQRAVLPGAIDTVRMVVKENSKGIGALDPG